MSVAFVKEPNDSQVETLPDRDLGTIANLVTARGLALIERELAQLISALDQARTIDDKISIAHIQRDLRYWNARKATAEIVAPPAANDAVQFGSRVTIERTGGQRQVFRIVGLDEADPPSGLLSYAAPLARSLVGRSVGDVVLAGSTEAEIVAIDVVPIDVPLAAGED